MSLSVFKRNPSHLGKKTAKQRQSEFKDKTYVDDGVLFCSACATSLDHRRRSSILNHFESSKKHKQNEERLASLALKSSQSTSRHQITLTTAFTKNTAKEKKDLLIHDLVCAFASADIPLEKLNNDLLRGFFQKHVQNGGCIPSADRLRRAYLKPAYDESMEGIRKLLDLAKFITVIADETTDRNNRPILNVVVIASLELSDGVKKLKPWLIETVKLDSTNGNAVGGAVLRTLVENRIAYNKVVAFVSDNVNYMAVAYRIVQSVCQTAIHITCWAHVFALVGETWRRSFPDVDVFVASMKKLFKNSRKKKSLFFQVLKEAGVAKPKSPPSPIVTRWGSWFEAVAYHSKYFEHYPKFVEELAAIEDETSAFETIRDVVTTQFKEVQQKLRFIAVLSLRIRKAILISEGQLIASHSVYDLGFKLLNWAEALTEKDFSTELELEGFGPKAVRKLNQNLHDAVVACHGKLKKYVVDGGQPGMDFFKAARVFDPSQLPTLSQDLSSYTAIPGLNAKDEKMKGEWTTYKTMAKEAFPGVGATLEEESDSDTGSSDENEQGGSDNEDSANEAEDSFSLFEANKMEEGIEDPPKKVSSLQSYHNHISAVVDFWASAGGKIPRLTKLASMSLAIPISSVDVERSFSSLNSVFSEKRRNLTITNLKFLTRLYFNSERK